LIFAGGQQGCTHFAGAAHDANLKP